MGGRDPASLQSRPACGQAASAGLAGQPWQGPGSLVAALSSGAHCAGAVWVQQGCLGGGDPASLQGRPACGETASAGLAGQPWQGAHDTCKQGGRASPAASPAQGVHCTILAPCTQPQLSHALDLLGSPGRGLVIHAARRTCIALPPSCASCALGWSVTCLEQVLLLAAVRAGRLCWAAITRTHRLCQQGAYAAPAALSVQGMTQAALEESAAGTLNCSISSSPR